MAAADTSSGKGIHAINITPMVDIILVLLVIFMVTSSAINAAESVDVDKPEAASGQASGDESTTLVVTCDPQGRFYVGDEVFEDGAAITAHAQQVLRAAPKTQAVLRCDRDSKVDHLVTLIDALRLAGVTKYAIATEPPAAGR